MTAKPLKTDKVVVTCMNKKKQSERTGRKRGSGNRAVKAYPGVRPERGRIEGV